MRNLKTKFAALLFTGLFVSSAALAQGVIEQEAEGFTGVFESPFALSPRVGALGYQAPTGEYQGRATYGLSLRFGPEIGMVNNTTSNIRAGIETGMMFAHVGTRDAGFFGTSEEGSPNANANSFVVPMNIYGGWQFSDSFLVAFHAGAAGIYQNQSGSIALGRSVDVGDTSFEIFPAAGLNLGWALGENSALTLRGDYVPTPVDDIVTTSLGLTFGLG